MGLVQLHAKRLATTFLMALAAAIAALILVATAPASGAVRPGAVSFVLPIS